MAFAADDLSARLIGLVIRARQTGPGRFAGQGETMLELLRAGVAGQPTVLDDAEVTGRGVVQPTQ